MYMTIPQTTDSSGSGDWTYDYSTPEARVALDDVTRLVLEVREETVGSLERKIRLYERTLGLAVIPVLLRRALIVTLRAVGRKQHKR